MKRNETTGTGRRLGATTLALVAAGLTAAAFAAFSIAESGDDGDGSGKDRVEHALFPAPPPPGGPGFFHGSRQDREALEAFRRCMEDQGLEPPRHERGEALPEPPSEQEMKEMREAFEACEEKLPEGAHALPGPPPCGDGDGKGRDENREPRA
jgi:hypothetical protein